MRGEDLLRKIEVSFGKYQPGMRSHIATELHEAPEDTCRSLYSMVMKTHDQKSPPSWATLYKLVRGAGLALGSGGYHRYESVCEGCGRGYDMEFRNCPACGHRRAFGMVRRRGVTVEESMGTGVGVYQT